MNLSFFRRPVTSVLVKPAGADCNLDCAYCFYSRTLNAHSSPRPRMSEIVLETMIRQLLSQPVPHLSFGWQGGEPTLMGLPFYERAASFMDRYGRGQSVANGLQTNGLLIDRAWARFFRKYHFLVGISLDGPEHIHDHYRKDRGGGGSGRKAGAAARLLLDEGVEVNALSVVNSYSVRFPDEIYEYHKNLGLRFMQFIPCVERAADGVSDFSVSAGAYGAFLSRLFDLWLEDFQDGAPTTSIRFFEALMLQEAGFTPTECTLLETCGSYLLVEHSGEVYSCDFFVEPGRQLGNLLDTPLPALFNSPQHVSFGRLKSKLPAKCRTCEWRAQCRGGCTKDRLRSPQTGGDSYFCEAYQQFLAYAQPRLRQMAGDWKRNQHGSIH
jgi:uncharacterized protein